VVADDEAVARRIAALVVAERAGAEASDLTRAVERLRRAGGDAECLAADAVVAAFDDATDAVVAATQLHRGVPGATAETARTPWRVGIDVGEIVIRTEGAATRMAIERARALARVARPGTTAIRTAARSAIGQTRDVTVEALAPTEAGEEAVCLLVPLGAPSPSLRRRRLMFVLAGGALFAGGGVWMAVHRGRRGRDAERLTLLVSPFRLFRTDAQHTRIGIALRDGLNTELSELSGVKVYAREFVDFLMSRERLAEIEVATRLGIEKMLSGTIVVVGDSVRVDAQVVDVASGVLEGSYTTVGREEDFLALETDVIVGVIARLRLPLTPYDERRLAARRAIDPESFRRLREAEGAPATRAPFELPPLPGSGPPRSLLGPSAAFADDAAADVAVVLEDYRRATEARDIPALAALYVSFSPEQRAGVERYFAGVADLRVRLTDVDVAVVGDEAITSYTRVDEFTDVSTGRQQRVPLRVTRTLRRIDGRWRLAEVR
jgi:TolB-like protein/ketosteroid isomerase-like protein